MVSPSSTRVPEQTPGHVNEQIRRKTEKNIAYYAARPQEIDQRLRELDEEWDIERTLETNAASLALGGSILALLFGRKWLVVPLVVSGFLLQHAIQGWCPPVELFRRLGVRTQQEIDQERYALKALRGDFKDLRGGREQDLEQLLDATSR